jgi:hypothetical protein
MNLSRTQPCLSSRASWEARYSRATISSHGAAHQSHLAACLADPLFTGEAVMSPHRPVYRRAGAYSFQFISESVARNEDGLVLKSTWHEKINRWGTRKVICNNEYTASRVGTDPLYHSVACHCRQAPWQNAASAPSHCLDSTINVNNDIVSVFVIPNKPVIVFLYANSSCSNRPERQCIWRAGR